MRSVETIRETLNDATDDLEITRGLLMEVWHQWENNGSVAASLISRIVDFIEPTEREYPNLD